MGGVVSKIFGAIKDIGQGIKKGVKSLGIIGSAIFTIMEVILNGVQIIVMIVDVIIWIIRDLIDNGGKNIMKLVLYLFCSILGYMIDIDILGISIGGLLIGILMYPIQFVLNSLSIVWSAITMLLVMIPAGLFYLIDYIIFKSSMASNKKQRMVSMYNLFYRLFVACENSPHQWFKYMAGEKYVNDSLGVVTFSPCPPGYRSRNGKTTAIMCEGIPGYIPQLSPQSQIYRLSRGMRSAGHAIPKEFELVGTRIQNNDPYERKKLLKKYREDVSNYYKASNKSMRKYDVISKNECRMCDSNNHVLVATCRNTYCSNGRFEPFCSKFTNKKNFILGKYLHRMQFGQHSTMINILSKVFIVSTIFLLLFLLNPSILSRKFD